jgi:hypothetical protein
VGLSYWSSLGEALFTQVLLVQSANWLQRIFLRGASGLLFFMVSSCAVAQLSLLTHIENQRRFDAAYQAMSVGEYDVAMDLFQDLYRDTEAIRVKLEWARSAFLAKNFDLSRELFLSVLEEPIPDSVRFNISLYLTEIDRLGNLTDWGFSFTREKNPFRIPESQDIIIFGNTFSYVPPEPAKSLSGIRGYAHHSRSLNSSGNFRFIGDFYGTIYEGAKNNRGHVNIRFDYQLPFVENTDLNVGADHYFQRSEILRRQSYVGLNYRIDQLQGLLNQVDVSTRAGKNKFPDYQRLDGETLYLSVYGAKDISSRLRFGIGLNLEGSQAGFSLDDYVKTGFLVNAKFFLTDIRSSLGIAYSFSERKYGDEDPLFQVRRVDQEQLATISVKPFGFKVFGMFPSLDFSIEEINSTIPLKSAKRSMVNFELRKNY